MLLVKTSLKIRSKFVRIEFILRVVYTPKRTSTMKISRCVFTQPGRLYFAKGRDGLMFLPLIKNLKITEDDAVKHTTWFCYFDEKRALDFRCMHVVAINKPRPGKGHKVLRS